MIRLRLPGIPDKAMVDPTSGALRAIWLGWFRAVVMQVDASPAVLKVVNLSDQHAAIITTTIPLGIIPTALYRLTYYARITRAATSSSSVAVTIGWTDGGSICAYTGAAVTGNATTSVQTASLLVKADTNTLITYAVAYASSGATEAQFSLDVVVEAIPEGAA